MGYCRRCQSEYAKKRSREQYKKIRGYLDELKKVPCADCGEAHPSWAMDFDHRKGTKKAFNLGEAPSRGFPLKKVQAEVEKCDVVCTLCHRYRTFGKKRKIKGL